MFIQYIIVYNAHCVISQKNFLFILIFLKISAIIEMLILGNCKMRSPNKLKGSIPNEQTEQKECGRP